MLSKSHVHMARRIDKKVPCVLIFRGEGRGGRARERGMRTKMCSVLQGEKGVVGRQEERLLRDV